MSTPAYPRTWADFIGQEKAKARLLLAAQSARKRGAVCDHVLLAAGQGGIGKTALAKLFARELGKKVHEVSEAVRMADARAVLMDMCDGDVLFYDEIHKVMDGGKKNAEWLLHLLQDGVLMTPLGPEEVPRITLIGATTDAAKLPQTIRSRFGIVPPLVSYSDDEATRIAVGMATAKFAGVAQPTTGNLRSIAVAANNIPRRIEKLLGLLLDLAATESIAHKKASGYDLAVFFEMAELTTDGLDHEAQTYLRTLRGAPFNGGPVGESTLMAVMAEPAGMGQVEAMLITKGLLQRTPQGRMLTKAGMTRAKELLAQAGDLAA